jgi:proline iminopeptidase
MSAVHPPGRHTNIPGGRVWYEAEGDGEPLVLVTGGPGTGHDHYHPWFTALAGGRRVVYVDFPGTGRSDALADPTGYTVAAYAATIDAVRRDLGAERISLVGLSFGAIPGLEYAIRYPDRVRRLVLSNGQVSARTWQESNIDNVNRELAAQFPEVWEQLLAIRARGVRSLDPRYQELVATILPDLNWVDPWGHPRLAEGTFSEEVYRAFIGDDPEWTVSGTLAGYEPDLADVRMPVLVVTGRYDRVTTPRVAYECCRGLPAGAQLVVFERSAHRPWVEESADYTAVLDRFLGG